MIVFDCQVCRKKLSAREAQAGAAVQCPYCKATLKVPKPEMAMSGATGAEVPPAPPRMSGAIASFSKATGGGKRYGFNCPYCSSRLEATESMAAQDGQCPTCGSTITIPIQDRYGRLIDPKTREIIKQDPHPVHAYAAAGERAPAILRQKDGKQLIRCARCSAANPITANNCKACGMPFTMEGTTVAAAGASNGFCVASLVLGIIGMPTSCFVLPSLLAVIFGAIGYSQTRGGGWQQTGRAMAMAGMICGGLGCLLAVLWYAGKL